MTFNSQSRNKHDFLGSDSSITSSSWWFFTNPPTRNTWQVKLDHLPKDRGENQYLKPPPSNLYFIYFLNGLWTSTKFMKKHCINLELFFFPPGKIRWRCSGWTLSATWWAWMEERHFLARNSHIYRSLNLFSGPQCRQDPKGRIFCSPYSWYLRYVCFTRSDEISDNETTNLN